MKIGSLCTGIGGLDESVKEIFGATIAWCSEVDPAANRVIAGMGYHNIGSVIRNDWSDVEYVDIITAGYPCQPFSLAGKRKGNQDERHLWPHVYQAIRQLRPRYVVLENVPGHVSLGLRDVLGDLALLRYDAEWTCMRASDVGAAHRRERLFILATNADSLAG